MTASEDKGVWVFGYGSLIWKVDFPIEDQKFGCITGYARRFWQKSHDHRGTEQNPGFVVTLLQLEELQKLENTDASNLESICWGMAYKIKSGHEEQVLKHLDFREKDGYTIHRVNVHSSEPSKNNPDQSVIVSNAIVYIGRTDNPSFGGPVSIQTVAKTIHKSVGPSGSNKEYLLNLCHALRSKSSNALDTHLAQLEEIILELDTTTPVSPLLSHNSIHTKV
ncbi:hypothetical protein BB559_003448 [Furculomyces boomerangus]|uniref:glutathione-specific gamma-glutamylcyclotransferase n=2 Tax=Harpellales TaxID=61421 RepID=A0A2T9YL69_9FUNG|nr:hypothetical protein BB559_003448 [Furculomyces boomerangus]PWA03649.1 hypothetical protein BB558_000194 [Smittium angustum]